MEDEVVHALQDMHFDKPMIQPLVPSFDQFQDLLIHLTDSLKTKKEDNPLNVARLESYISKGLSFKFNGKKDKFVPWIKKFHTLHTNAIWQEATYVIIDSKSYDLLIDFTMISEVHIRAQAHNHWTADNQIKSLKVEFP
jgi:hypothetical protein